MKAIVLQEAGGAEKLISAEVPVPAVKKGEVLVRVKATSINPVDIKTRNGKSLYNELKSKHSSIILGWDISGIVEETGPGVTRVKTGDEVFGMVGFPGQGAAYAEYVTAPEGELAIKPARVSHEEAAGATMAALTAWQALVTQAKLQKGQRALIHAASGGVGHYAVQIAKYLGAYVIATSSAANRDFVLGLGADEHIDYKTQNLEEAVQEVDFTLNPVGGDTVDTSIAVTKPGGTVIVLPGGQLTEEKLEKARQKNINCYFFVVESSNQNIQTLAALLEKGIIRSYVSKTFSLENMREAHAQIETGRTRGKIVAVI